MELSALYIRFCHQKKKNEETVVLALDLKKIIFQQSRCITRIRWDHIVRSLLCYGAGSLRSGAFGGLGRGLLVTAFG